MPDRIPLRPSWGGRMYVRTKSPLYYRSSPPSGPLPKKVMANKLGTVELMIMAGYTALSAWTVWTHNFFVLTAIAKDVLFLVFVSSQPLAFN